MPIAQTLAPLIVLVSLGVALASLHFLTDRMVADFTRLTFWVSLPALLFREAAHAGHPGAATWRLLAVLIATTLIAAAVGWLVCVAIGLPRRARGTMIQSAFRGNLAYIGLPVVTYSLAALPADDRVHALATTVIAMTLTMALYNALAVVVLEASRPAAAAGEGRLVLRSVATNPLLVSGVSGLAVSVAGLTLPAFLDRTLDTLGGAAVPVALICIGGSLTTARFDGRRAWIGLAAALKVLAVPAIMAALLPFAGLGPIERRVALVFAATPTAAAAYVMAREMEGDETLASGSIALSTLLSLASLAIVLWLTR